MIINYNFRHKTNKVQINMIYCNGSNKIQSNQKVMMYKDNFNRSQMYLKNRMILNQIFRINILINLNFLLGMNNKLRINHKVNLL